MPRAGHARRSARYAVARGMGDSVPPGATSFADLAAQVNRFGPDAPAEHRLVLTPFLATGTLDSGLALTAITIYQRRATAAYDQFGDRGSALEIERANEGFANPVVWVTTHLAEVTQAIAGYADSLGLPGGAAGSGGLSTTMLLLLAGVGLAIWFVGR